MSLKANRKDNKTGLFNRWNQSLISRYV